MKNYNYCLRIIGWSSILTLEVEGKKENKNRDHEWGKRISLILLLTWPLNFHIHTSILASAKQKVQTADGIHCSCRSPHLPLVSGVSIWKRASSNQVCVQGWQGRGLLWSLKAVVFPCGHSIKTTFTTSFQKPEHWSPTLLCVATYN